MMSTTCRVVARRPLMRSTFVTPSHPLCSRPTLAFRCLATAAAQKPRNNTRLRVVAFATTSMLIAGTAGAYLRAREEEHSSSAPDQKTNFQVMAALEMKQELEKVRLAQIVYELHEMAKEAAGDKKVNLKKSLTQALKAVSKSQTSLLTQDNEINSPKRVNWLEIKPSEAQEYVQALQQGGKFNEKDLVSLLEASTIRLKEDPTLVNLSQATNITVVGDLHGSLSCLQTVLELVGPIGGKTNKIVVFNGDFVDRGESSLEVFCTLLLLKLAYPEHVYLIRGNHEDPFVASVYGFEDEVLAKYGTRQHENLWSALSKVFSALPVCVKTKTAAILHGGIPTKDFDLEEVESITTRERCMVQSTIEPRSDVEKLMHGILWSDPGSYSGIRENRSRGAGVMFGPDVARHFLERHGLSYLIRSHEVAEKGTKVMDCRGGRAVLTVFSTASYPCGKGCNLGAVLHLLKDGSYEAVDFVYHDPKRSKSKSGGEDVHMDTLWSLIAASKVTLSKSFEAIDEDGLVTPEQWAQVMANKLELVDAPWMALQPTMAPAHYGELIDWRDFLETRTSSLSTSKGVDMERLYANHEILLTIFKFLDVDGNGSVDLSEFKAGIDLLNKRLPQDKKLGDPKRLFDALDSDGNGVIDLQEFSDGFSIV